MPLRKIHMLFAALALALCASAASAQQPAGDFVVTTLGTGSPPPDMRRFGPATLVKAGKQTLLFDAGRGVTQRLGQANTQLGKIDAVFLTHLHSDHVVGIPDLWLMGWLPGPYGRREGPFRIWGPQGTKGLMAGLEQAFAWDIRSRIADQKLSKIAISVEADEIQQGVVYDRDGVRVTAFEVDHGEELKPAFGYRIDYDGRSVVISGDTKFSENLIKFSASVDLLIHQAGMAKDGLRSSSPAVQAILAHHTMPEEAGVVFSRTQPKLAVYYHLVLQGGPQFPPPTENDVVERTRTTYSGPLVVADDLMKFVIDKTGVTVIAP